MPACQKIRVRSARIFALPFLVEKQGFSTNWRMRRRFKRPACASGFIRRDRDADRSAEADPRVIGLTGQLLWLRLPGRCGIMGHGTGQTGDNAI